MEQELIHDLVAAYALDALDDSERREFEDHLAGCEQCAEELEGLRAAAAALAYVPEGPAPPPALRDRLLERVHAEHAPAANVVPLRRHFALPAVATFGALAAAAAIALAVWATSLSSSLDRQDAIAGVLGDPTSAHVAMGAGNQVVIGSNGQAVLVSSLARAPQGKTYELWVIEAGKPRPAGLFAGGKSSSPLLLSRHVPLGAKVGLSIERQGGAGRPTHIVDVTPPI